MNPPISLKKVRMFIGVINYYPYMWPSRSHTLSPLTILLSIKTKFKRTQFKTDVFERIEQIMARNTLLAYPYFNEIFKIHTDAIMFQLGVVVIQKGRPIAFYSRNITDYQQQYTVT